MIFLALNRQVKTDLSTAWFKKVIKIIWPILKLKGDYDLSLALVGERAIKKLNWQCRKKDQATDVLSFVAGDRFPDPSTQNQDLGEIVICLPIAQKQARESNQNLKGEVADLFIHGLLHLLGHDHKGVSSRRVNKMFVLAAKLRQKLDF